ncbi:UNVERIFIED_CONTAM: hypothetical protein Slati_1338000 [Sesamum latifolium]|uniref:Uncharacterized protein n=1 Tax=Sesamum latifolium TaxID=2727402 RepID=A0AAW2XKD9_9LAMI
MEGTSQGDKPRRDEGPSKQVEPLVQITRSELQRLMKEARRNALVQHETRTATLTREGKRKKRVPGISRAEVDDVGRQIERLGKQIDELKRRGEIVAQNRNSPFSNKILTEVEDPSFIMPDLPKYDGTKDSQEHVTAFELVMNLYDQSGATRICLARDLPEDVEQLMRVAQKYIDEEEINAMKDGEWQRSRDRGRWKENRENHIRSDKERDPPYRSKFHRYMPLATTRTKALMMVEKSNLLQWPQHTRFTPAKKYSNKYCKFHKERGHDMEDRYQLKDEIERLVRQGYFKKYILGQGIRSRDHKVGDRRTRSRSRSRER